MKTLLSCSMALGLCLASIPASRAADLGDPAAPLKIAEWVKGNPVDLAAVKGKKIVVVEFWATWCPPCRTSIPHLTELQKKFKAKDVIFVGISDEKAATVKKFVQQMGDKMDYVVAIDDENQTSEGYMRAYNQGGIPHAFIVDKQGRVLWQGHPMANLGETLDQIVAGTYDLATAKKRARADTLYEEFFQLAAKDEDPARQAELARELTKLAEELGGIQGGSKYDPEQIRKQARFQSALREYQMALGRGESDPSLEVLGEKIKANAPEAFDFDEFKKHFKTQQVFMNYYRIASGRSADGDLEAATRAMQELKSDNAEALNNIAWTLLTDEKIEKRDLKLAMKFAQAAYDASEGKQPHIIDTYARALFDTGKIADAIKYQQEAIKLCEDDELAAQLKKTLEGYEAKRSDK